MLTALEDAKRNGASIVAVNPLPEAGLRRFKNPQTVRGLVGRGTDTGRPVPADPLRRRHGAAAGGLAAGPRGRGRRSPGTVLDHEFLDRYTLGLDEFRAHLAASRRGRGARGDRA